MCGMIGAVGPVSGDVSGYLRDGLGQIEYRGYDSHGYAGHVNVDNPRLSVKHFQAVGPVSSSPRKWPALYSGISHTRWASHGEVSTLNAHPIEGLAGEPVFVVANGIVDNYLELRQKLQGQLLFETGHCNWSETDTESLAHQASYCLKDATSPADILLAGRQAMDLATGQYSALVLFHNQPNRILILSRGLPVYVTTTGLIASDPAAFQGFAEPGCYYCRIAENTCLLIEFDGQDNEVVFYSLDNYIKASFQVEKAEPQSRKLIAGQFMRSEMDEWVGQVGREASTPVSLSHARLHTFVGCGSSYHAAQYGAYIFNLLGPALPFHYAATPAETSLVSASESPWFITQSGETADILECMKAVQGTRLSPFHLICNRPHSSAAQMLSESSHHVAMDCGPERAVAATKSFAMTCLRLLELACAQFGETLYYGALFRSVVEASLLDVGDLVKSLVAHDSSYVVANGIYYPFAREAALKLKECAYLQCEGLLLSEFKHGPMATLGNYVLPIVIVASRRDLSNLNEIYARCPGVWAICEPEFAGEVYCNKIILPEVSQEICKPFPFIFILQQLAYQCAMAKNIDPDMPRNICKSVTIQ